MESALFEEILLGDFPGFEMAGDRKTALKTLKIAGLLDEAIPADRQGILSLRQKIYQAITNLSGNNMETPKAPGKDDDSVLVPGQWYFKPVPISKGKHGIQEKLVSALIECECRLLMGALHSYLRDENKREDAIYFGSLAIRKWSDYLQQSVSASPEIRITQTYLFAILCDLSERLREKEWEGVDYVTPDWIREIFPSSDQFGSLIYPTITFTNLRLLRISLKPREEWKEQFIDLTSEIMDLIHQNRDYPQVIQELTGSLAVVERAIFLMEYQAPFLKGNPEKIANEGFMNEWIMDLQNDLQDEEINRIVHALQRTDTTLQRLPEYDTLNDEWSGIYEIRRMVYSHWSDQNAIDNSGKIPVRSKPGEKHKNGSEERKYSDTDEWAKKFANQYLTKKQVKDIFHITSNDVFVAFVERHSLTYHEVSTHHHLFDRSEVMELFEKIKRKG